MKRLLIILLCLPLIFACTTEEPFVEGEEIVLDMSVITDDVQSIATRAMGDNVVGTPALWLVVFDSNGLLVEWAKAYDFTQSTPEGKETITSFKARLHATLEGRIMHLLLNYDDDNNDATDLEFNYGHENNIIGGLFVERDRDVYWQRVVLPDGINNDNTVSNYLTEVPLVRNFSKITVTETDNDFELLGFYVLNVPKYGTVAPFHDGEFVKYHNENANFDGNTDFTTKSYQQLDVNEGYRGTIPNIDDERIQKASDCNESITLLSPTASYYLYENRYISGDKDRTVSVLLKGKYKGTDYWYRVDLVKKNPTTGVLEYFDVLRNFSYNIKITQATAGKTSVKDAIEHVAGNNVLSSLDIAHLTGISDGKATLEVNHTDTVLISRDVVYVRYKFTDTGSRNGFKNNTNEDIANKVSGDDCGWYLTAEDGNEAPITVTFDDNDDADGWRRVTVKVKDDSFDKPREEVSLTFIVTSSTGEILSRTIDYILLHQQKMLVECPSKVPAVVGSPVDVSILIPDKLPEAMFPLDFAIEAQGTDQSGTNKTYLAQHISPHKDEVMTVKTAGSIVPGFEGKKSFQYMVSFSYEDYLNATLTTRQLEAGGQDVPVRVFTKKFVTNTATSASRVYAYNKYFDLGSDNFINGTMKYFEVSFSDDVTATYGVGRTIKLNITAGEAGKYLIESNTLQSPTRAVLAELNMTANQSQTIDLVTSTFANRGKVLVTCMATGVMKEIFAAERNTLDAKALSAKYNGEDVQGTQSLNISRSENDALRGEGSASVTVTTLKNRTTITVPDIESEDDILYFSYINGNKIYIASATAGDLIAGTAALEFEEREIVVSITDLALSGSQYYGVGRDVTLTFNVTKTGTYTITQTEGSQTKTYTHEANSTGEQTVTLKTLTWGTQLNVTVSTTVGGVTYSEEVDGATRNVMKFGKVDVKRSSSNISDDEVIYITLRNSNNIIGSPKASELRNGGFELPINNINSNTELKLYYNDGSERRVYEDAETLIKGDITLTLSSRN